MALLFSVIVMTLALGATQSDGEQRWIIKLKKTPVSQLDPALPDKSFDSWLADQVRPAQPIYEVNDCGERKGSREEKGKEFPFCVSVTAEVPPGQKLELSFVVGTYTAGGDAAGKPQEKAAKIALFFGVLGPSDPRNKRPSQVIRKLSELPKILEAGK